MRLKNKNTIITGSGAGIGRATALRFAEEGAKVMIVDINGEDADKTARMLQKAGGQAEHQQADVSDPKAVERVVEATVSSFGSIQVLVNNAAAFVFGKIEETTAEDWQKVLGVNIIGYANMVQAVLPYLRANGAGAIVNVASVSSFIAQPAFVPYNTSKGGIMQMTRCLALDLAEDNIRVNGVCPGAIFTQGSADHMKFIGVSEAEGKKMFGQDAPMKRMGEPVEIANGILFLASDEASFVTGAHLVIDGGATID
jgi:NAD(P)-dependent dehydrogenase (short-subunit alcohol dehydrogenase family)